MKPETRAIVNFWELSPEWQEEAKSNLDEYAEENSYLEPEDNQNPKEHILWDLSDTVASKVIHEGFEYNAIMGISNNSGMLLKIDETGESAEILFV